MAWEERQTVLDGLAAGEDGRLRLVAAYRAEPTDELADAHIYLQSILEDLTREYLDHLEYRAISRCPHTGLVARHRRATSPRLPERARELHEPHLLRHAGSVR